MSDALEELEQLLPSIPAAVERQRVGAQLDRVNAKVGDFSNVTAKFTIIRSVAALIDFYDENIAEMREAALDAGRLLKEAFDESTLDLAGRSYDDLKTAISVAERSTRGQWRTVVTNEYRPIAVVGALLQRFGDTLDIGRRMVALAERADRSTALSITELPAEIAALASDRTKLEAEKAGMTKNGEVDDFLTKLAAGKATLSSVTPSVFSWLSEHDALDQLGVSPR
ncbi:hypothetical protein HFO69_26220 [Rhizobium laguerreae]|uniref:hypothetical protein n=1 Tax=Rhizobium laguerreae TaxID=1076926 RepID=UPI001C8FBB73|nr:hypothetical protein [Rhizobium laguerreae]MBY3101166.1 hypothetical protein [Rhizobium laguerreae]